MTTHPKLTPEMLDAAKRRLASEGTPIPRPPYKRVPAEVIAGEQPAVAASLDRPHWADVAHQAKLSAVAEFGEGWWKHPDAAVKVTLTTAASRQVWFGRDGEKHVRRLRKDRTLPKRRFWPPGTFPTVEIETAIKGYDPFSIAARMAGRWSYPGAEEDYRLFARRGVISPRMQEALDKAPPWNPAHLTAKQKRRCKQIAAQRARLPAPPRKLLPAPIIETVAVL